MVETEFVAFKTAFGRLSGSYRKRWRSGELEEAARGYFSGLIEFSLAEVEAGAGECLKLFPNRMPNAAQWRLATQRVSASEAGAAASHRQMAPDEAAEWSEAERLRYEGDACGCLLCQAAAIERPIRFVPEFDRADREYRAFHPGRNRVVVAGRWIHGSELARWYAARDLFYAAATRLGVLEIVKPLVSREPGEEG